MAVRPIIKPEQAASCCFRTTVTHPGPNPARAGAAHTDQQRSLARVPILPGRTFLPPAKHGLAEPSRSVLTP